MRFLLIALALISFLAAEEEAPRPTGVSAEESARIMAEIKSHRDAAAAAKGEEPAAPATAKPDAADKASDDADAKKAKAAKLADEYQDKAIKAAKAAVAQADQFKKRAAAEGGSAGGRGVYMHKVSLDSGASNGAVIEAADRVKDWLDKRDETRKSAGLPAIKTLSLTDFIVKNGD